MEVKSIGGDSFESIDYELQDGSSFLLLVAKIKNKTPQSELDKFKIKAKDAIEKEIPGLKNDYRWIITIKQNGEVVDSVLPNFVE